MERFVISGLSRLTVPVAQQLADKGEVVVLAKPGPGQQDNPYARLLMTTPRITVHYASDLQKALKDHLTPDVSCMLALADDDKENANAAADCYKLNPDMPVVLRTLDSTLADEFEQVKGSLNIRRAYDMSALSAPAFVALALSDEEFVETKMTMRFGPDQVPLCKLKIDKGSMLKGKTPRQLQHKLKCAVVARRTRNGAWQAGSGGKGKLIADDEIIIGGPQREVFRAVRGNSTKFPRKRVISIKKRVSASQRKLLKFAIPLAIILVCSTVVFWSALGISPFEAFYQMMVAASGEALTQAPIGLKLLALFLILVWVMLGGVLVALLTDVVLERRIGKQADDFRDHAVVGGLDDVGYRVAKLLGDIDVPTVVMASPNNRFVNEVDWDIPVLTGNIRLADDLKRAGIQRASCLIAVTTDDLANILACVHAERLEKQSGRKIRTIARLFDEELEQRFNFKQFSIDETLAAVDVAAAAFVDAATDNEALRHFEVGDDSYVGLRYPVTKTLHREDIAQWAAQGAIVLAFRQDSGETKGPLELPDTLEEGDSLIVVGPEAVISALA